MHRWEEDTTGEGKSNDVVEEGPDEVPVDSLDGCVGEIEEGDDVDEGVADKNGVGRFNRNFRSGAEGDADVGLGKGGTVVDTISDERDVVAFILELLDDGGLVLGKLLSKDVLFGIGDSNRARDAMSSVLVVTSDHDDADVALDQLLDEEVTFGLGFVGEGNADSDLSFGGEKNDGAAFVVRLLNEGAKVVVDGVVAVFLHQSQASNNDVVHLGVLVDALARRRAGAAVDAEFAGHSGATEKLGLQFEGRLESTEGSGETFRNGVR